MSSLERPVRETWVQSVQNNKMMIIAYFTGFWFSFEKSGWRNNFYFSKNASVLGSSSSIPDPRNVTANKKIAQRPNNSMVILIDRQKVPSQQ